MLRRLILTLVASLAICLPALAAGWESVQRAPQAMEYVEIEDVDFGLRDGYIYIATNHAVSIKVFTILGQTVSQATVQPGIFRLRLPAKGIYLVRIGATTRRVTV